MVVLVELVLGKHRWEPFYLPNIENIAVLKRNLVNVAISILINSLNYITIQ